MEFVSIMIYFAGDMLVYFMMVKYHIHVNMVLKRTWRSWWSPEKVLNIHCQIFVTTIIKNKWMKIIFNPRPLRPKGYCRHLRLSVCPSVGGWHFIAATAIKPPKAACQFAADDILLYKFCYNIQWIYFTIWEIGKEELSPLQYHFKSLHIISRHYKKSLLRSQIYHGYEELSTDTNYPIWRRQKLPYMKKTRKKKQVCGAACFMAAEIKFSEDVRLSVCPSVCLSVPIILVNTITQ